MNVNGISPKVGQPFAVLLLGGVAALIAGAFLDEAALTTVGGTLVAAAVGQLGLGYKADVGVLEPAAERGPKSDELLGDDARRELGL